MVEPSIDPLDPEKGIRLTDSPKPDSSVVSNESNSESLTRFAKWNARIESLAGLESRGITRVMPSERHEPSTFEYWQMALQWFSTNVTANNLAVGLLGPLVYKLSFLDSALCSVFGALVGSMGPAYISTWGPRSGHRTMIVARYFMGYYPSKICCLLNIILLLGYGVIDCVVGGQILSAVASDRISVIVGIIIVALISWLVAAFGMKIFHLYERWAWFPQLIVLFILVGSAGPKFNTTSPSEGDRTTINAHRLSFFSLCLSVPVSWAPAAADYYVYYSPTTSALKTFGMTFAGFTLSFSLVNLLGVGLASGTLTNPSWATAYSTSSGALIVAGYDGLGAFGKFCSVIVALGVVANNIPNTYSSALSFQVLGHYLQRLPRWLWTVICALIYTACALGGRNNLFDIFGSFLPLIGYWVTNFLTIVLEEHYIFHQRRKVEYDWDGWTDWRRVPVGTAALTAFLIGWAGSIVSMDQVYYVGPLAKMVGSDGADLGIWVGIGFVMISFPPLRALELRMLGR